jgi:hypothetical protein
LTDKISNLISTACLLTARLERLSADSSWAHRASGLRGSLLKAAQAGKEELENKRVSPETVHQIEKLLSQGFSILEQAAREIGDPKKDE